MKTHNIITIFITLILLLTNVYAIPVPEGCKRATHYILVGEDKIYEVVRIDFLEGSIWGYGYAVDIKSPYLLECRVLKKRSDGWYEGPLIYDDLNEKVLLIPTESPPEKEYEDVHAFIICTKKADVGYLGGRSYIKLRTSTYTFTVYEEEEIEHTPTEYNCNICDYNIYNYIYLPKGLYISYATYNPNEGYWEIYLSANMTENENFFSIVPIVKVLSNIDLTKAFVLKTLVTSFRTLLRTP